MGHTLTRNLLLIIGAKDAISGPLRKVQSAFRNVNSVASFAIKGISIALAAATTAVIAFGKASVDAFASFDTSMRNTWTLLNIGQDQFQALGDSILQMTSRVPQSPEQLGAAVYDIISAGVSDTSEALLVLEQSALAATAGVTTTKEAAGAAVSIMNAFGKTTADIPEIFDALFQTVNKGVVTFSQLGPAAARTAASFKGAGASIQDMLGALAFLTKTVGNADESSTKLRATMRALTKAAPELKKEMKTAVFDTAGNFRGLSSVVGDLTAALSGLTKEEQLARIRKLFPEQEAADAIVAMVNNYDLLKSTLEAVADSQGAMGQAAEKQLASWTNQVQFLKNAFTVMKTAMGELIAAVLGPELAKFTKWLQEVSGGLVENKAGMKAFVLAIVPVLKTVSSDVVSIIKGTMEVAWGFVKEFFRQFQESPRPLLVVLGGLFYEIPNLLWKALQNAWEVVKAVVEILWTPLQGSLVWVGDQIRAFFENTLKGNVIGFLNWLITQANKVREFLGMEKWELFEEAKPGAEAMKFEEAWKDTFGVLRERFADLGKAGKAALVQTINDAVDSVKELAGVLKGQLITPDLQAKIDAIQERLEGIPKALEEGYAQAGKAAEEAATAAKKALEETQAAAAAGPKPPTAPGAGGKGAAEKNAKSFGSIFGDAFASALGFAGGNAVASIVGVMFQAINEEDIGGFVDKFADGAVKFILALAKGIPTFILKFIERVPDIILALVEAIPVFIGEFIRMLPQILKAFADGIGKIFEAVAKLLALGFLVLVEKLIGGLLRFLGIELRDDIARLQGEVESLFAEASAPKAAPEPAAAAAEGTAQDFARTAEAGGQAAPVVVYNIDFSQPFVMADQTSMDQLARLLAEAEYRQARRSRGSTGT